METKVDKMETTQASMQTKVENVQTKVDDMQTTQATIQTNVVAVQTKVDNVQQSIEEMKEMLSKLLENKPWTPPTLEWI